MGDKPTRLNPSPPVDVKRGKKMTNFPNPLTLLGVIQGKKVVTVESYDINSAVGAWSYSERDEVFTSKEVSYEFKGPEQGDWAFTKKQPVSGLYFLAMEGEIQHGFICRRFFVLMGEVFGSFAECQDSEYFHPSDYQACWDWQVADAVQNQQEMLEDGCYGD